MTWLEVQVRVAALEGLATYALSHPDVPAELAALPDAGVVSWDGTTLRLCVCQCVDVDVVVDADGATHSVVVP